MVISRAQQYLLENTLSTRLLRRQVCVGACPVVSKHCVLQPLLSQRISQRKLLNNVYCFVVVFFLQFKQLQRVVTMALKSLYRVCEIKKLDLIFSSFSVRSQNHSYKNSIVFRLARHLCSSTSLVVIYWLLEREKIAIIIIFIDAVLYSFQ